jgi:hypothetical protein
MHWTGATCILVLLASGGCSREPGRVLPNPIDVSGDDCTASALVYDRRLTSADAPAAGTPFINDGCFGDRIFLGIDGERRELTRAENVPLGTGGEYSDGEYRVLVTRGRNVYRREVPDGECGEPEREYAMAYDAHVRIRGEGRSWSIDGTLRLSECAP